MGITRAEYFQFGSIWFWIKINNQIKIIIFKIFEPNRKPVQTDQFRFGFFPFQTGRFDSLA